MRALEIARLDGPNGLEVVQRPDPEADGRVLVDVRAAGVSFPDLLISQGRYQNTPELPFTPGFEIAGTVRSAPDGSGLDVGARVWASLGGGGCASVVRVSPKLVQPLSEDLSFEQGAALGVNYCTAVFALLRRGGLVRGETVLVTGAAGGLGTALIGVAVATGARVLAIVSSEEKAATAREAGAAEAVVGDDWRDRVLELTDGRGVDLAADVVGGEATLAALRSTARGGRVLVLGFPGGIPSIATNRLLLRNISLIGAGLGEYAAIDPAIFELSSAEVNRLIDAGLRPLIGARYSLDEAADAFRALEDRTARGKLVLSL